MSNKSFSAETKEALANLEPKKKCCKHAFTDAVNAFSKGTANGILSAESLGRIRCEGCLKEYLRGAFIAVGSVTDPTKRYHLDFLLTHESDAEALITALNEAGFTPGSTKRKSSHVVYFKDNDIIGDFLAYIGAVKAAFEIMNSKIVKEVRNNANRLVNCDTANIEKALSASQKYIEAIEYIVSKGALTVLPSELREAADLRVTFPQVSLSELASKCQPPITKSGMKHRLEKLLAYAAELKGRNTDN